jgi:hypothetical protein
MILTNCLDITDFSLWIPATITLQKQHSLSKQFSFGTKLIRGLNMRVLGWQSSLVNAALVISSENFMKNVNFVNMLKMRAGIGASGNDDIESTAARTYFSAVKYSYYLTGVHINNIANPAIQWETVTKRNLGLDASLFNDRLSLSFDMYNNTTNNLLVLKTPAPYSGMGTYWTNDGKLSNRGYELISMPVNQHKRPECNFRSKYCCIQKQNPFTYRWRLQHQSIRSRNSDCCKPTYRSVCGISDKWRIQHSR